MRCVLLMFDSLNRKFLPPYGAEGVHAPNFDRLAAETVVFDKAYVCSMPCMPARRDFHTGRPNFLHCPWGPLEPFDDSVPEMLKQGDVHTSLLTDHYHYWEDGGATYHNRYTDYEFFRGQENDAWKGVVDDPDIPDNINGKGSRANWVNRTFLQDPADHYQTQTVTAGLEWIQRNARAQKPWFLTIELFDPHEPFLADPQHRGHYPADDPADPLFDWPGYRKVTESERDQERVRNNYKGLLTQCDATVGRVLDAFDRHDLWQDTMLVVWTDHGFLLGEHGWWAKNTPPLYEEVSHTPFFIWDPRSAKMGERRRSLVQPSIDLGPTLLRFFDQEPTADMTGKDLAPVIAEDQPVRDTAIFGYFANRVNITDGRYAYYRRQRVTRETPTYTYTLMPTTMRGYKAMKNVELVDPFPFTKGRKLLRSGGFPEADPAPPDSEDPEDRDLLFDVDADPDQQDPLSDQTVTERLKAAMAERMAEVHAPPEAFARMGLTRPERSRNASAR
ncbi:MAG: sulfatase [Opitutales bacterium]